MDNQDRDAIEGLFKRLAEAGRQAGPRDEDAERLIATRMAAEPGSAYLMAQTLVMQDMALEAQQRELESAKSEAAALKRAAEQRVPEPVRSGGFLPRTTGGGSVPQVCGGRVDPWGTPRSPVTAQPQPAPAAPQYAAPQPQYAPAQNSLAAPGFASRFGGGGFLAGAAQTAVGVAGGMVVGNMLANMFEGHGTAAAAGLGGVTENITENVTINEADSLHPGTEATQPSEPALDTVAPVGDGLTDASFSDNTVDPSYDDTPLDADWSNDSGGGYDEI